MELSEILNLVLGGGLLAAVIGLLCPLHTICTRIDRWMCEQECRSPRS